MLPIQSLDPQKILEETDSEYYMIILVTANGEFAWQGNALVAFGGDYLDITLISKQDLVGTYFKVLREVRTETIPRLFESGSLTIAAVSKFMP